MNPYDTLGVRKNATKVEIHKAYKELLDKYDLNNYAGDPTFANMRVEKIVEAYNILSNTEKRAEYDNAHQSHVEAHKTKKDVYNPYYKKPTYSQEHIHEDMDIAQDKYENFQKYQNSSLEERQKKAVIALVWIILFFFVIVPMLQFIPALIILLISLF